MRSIVINPSVCASVCLCVSMSVGLSASISLELLDRSSRNFVFGSHVAVARSSSGGVALRYLLPVLWMTSRLAVMGATPKGGGWHMQRRMTWRYRGGVWYLWMPCLVLRLCCRLPHKLSCLFVFSLIHFDRLMYRVLAHSLLVPVYNCDSFATWVGRYMAMNADTYWLILIVLLSHWTDSSRETPS